MPEFIQVSLSISGSSNGIDSGSDADAQLPDGCTPVGVALAALFLLKKLPRPLISKKTARKLTTAAQESLLRPDYQEVAIYVAKCAVQELRPSTSGNTVSRGAFAKFNIFLLLKGIIRTLREVAEHEHVRCPSLNLQPQLHLHAAKSVYFAVFHCDGAVMGTAPAACTVITVRNASEHKH